MCGPQFFVLNQDQWACEILWERRGEEPILNGCSWCNATNLNGQDKLCSWPGQKPHTSKQVFLAGFELLLEWKKEDRNSIKLLVWDNSIVLFERELLHFLNPKILFPDIQRIFVKKWPYFAIFWKLINKLIIIFLQQVPACMQTKYKRVLKLEKNPTEKEKKNPG